MASTALVVALSAVFASSAAASQTDRIEGAGAPSAPPEARYCLRVEPHTGTRIESVECWTREEWAQAEVDVDKEWSREGVRVIA